MNVKSVLFVGKIPLRGGMAKVQRIFDGVVLMILDDTGCKFLPHKNHEDDSFENRRAH